MFRGMRRTKQQLADAEAVAILEAGSAGVLAVVGDDDHPYAVPLSYAYEDGKLFFHSAVAGHKLDAIARQPKVSFCVIGADDVVQSTFTTHYSSVIAFGAARVLTDDSEKRHALRLLAAKYSPDYLDNADSEIDGAWNRTCAVEIAIEHLSGKAALEVVQDKM